MGGVKRVKTGDLNEDDLAKIELSHKIIHACSFYVDSLGSGGIIGSMATALAVFMATVLRNVEKDEAMEILSDLTDDIKKATFYQIEMINAAKEDE